MDTEEASIKAKMSAHLKYLMSDTQLYSWEHTRAFHGIWLNQLEQDRCTWFDEEAKLQFHRSIVWHSACTSPSHPTISRTSPRIRQCRSQASHNAPVKPGTKACKAFNEGKYGKQMAHASLQHICSYCLEL